MPLQPGTRLGPYEVIAPLGAGGMGEVYRGRDTRLERTVAIKVLPPALALDPEFRARFDREARSISALNHPHVCTLYDVGEISAPDTGTVAYLVMEHLEGETLAERLRKGALPIEAALEYACQVADALEKAHRHGIIHRDLKPANVFLVRGGANAGSVACKLLDFGLARAGAVLTPGSTETRLASSPALSQGAAAARAPLTAQGTILGTFQYMAPEQIEGQDADARADIWAFGCVVYEMLTGRAAFDGRSQASLIAAILERQPTPLAELLPMTPPALDRLVRTCLQKSPEDRFHTAHDLRLQLEWIREGGSAAGLPAPVIAKRRHRERWQWAALSLALAALTGAPAWSLKPAPAVSRVMTRFTHELPEDVAFSRLGRRVVAVSPDGTRIAFIANQQIYLRSMWDQQALPVRGTGVDPLDLTFSPDGEWIAFAVPDAMNAPVSTARVTLKKIQVGGGTPVPLCDMGPPFGIRWESDQILFSDGARIQLVSENGGTPEVLVDAAKQQLGSVSQPQLVDHGRAVLYSSRTEQGGFDEGQIFLQPRSGTARALGTGTDARLLPGGVLIYVRSSTLFAQLLDPRTLEPAGGAIPVLEDVFHGEVTGVAQFGVSDTGTLVMLRGTNSGTRSLIWMDRSGRQEPAGPPPALFRLARVSPDGTKIAMSIGETDGDIWIWDMRRKSMSRLTSGAADDNAPTWTPDSRTIIFRSTLDGAGDLYRRAVDGTGSLERLTEGDRVITPLSFGPDAARLLVRVTAPGSHGGDLAWVSLDRRGAPLPLMPDASVAFTNGEISPDGRWLAYNSTEAGPADEVFVRPLRNPNAGRWQVSLEGGTHPVWNRNGRELFYRKANSLMSVAVATVADGAAFDYSAPQQVFAALGGSVFFGDVGRAYDVTPDGSRFVVTQFDAGGARPTAVTVVTHWRDELDRLLKRK